MMQLASHPSRQDRGHAPARHARRAGACSAPRTKLAHMVYVDDRRHRAARPPRREGRPLPVGRAQARQGPGRARALPRDAGRRRDASRSAATAPTARTTSTCCGSCTWRPSSARTRASIAACCRPSACSRWRPSTARGRCGSSGDRLDRARQARRPRALRPRPPEWRPLLNPVNTLVYSASGASVRTVLVDGRVVLDEAG